MPLIEKPISGRCKSSEEDRTAPRSAGPTGVHCQTKQETQAPEKDGVSREIGYPGLVNPLSEAFALAGEPPDAKGVSKDDEPEKVSEEY